MTTPSLPEMTRVFGRIGLLSFGGPAAQISLMHRELVEDRDWLSEQSYLRALSLCMMLPGPEAMQLATYAGWRLRGVLGGLIGGGLFVLPGALIIVVLTLAYSSFGQIPMVQAAFLGIKAAVIVIVVQALIRLSGKALGSGLARALAVAAFAAIFVFGLAFPLVVLGAGLVGAAYMGEPAANTATPPHVPFAQTLRTIAFWGALWAVPLALAYAFDPTFLGALGLFFSKLAVVTFGGAYAVLAYMTQTVVADYGWLNTAQMIDALGLAETTPGPLILVTQFVAILAGIGQHGWAFGLLAGALALWVTFIPCFLWIFAAAPYVESLAHRPRLGAALRAITAAVVGVIAQLALWFALHVLFADISNFGPMPLPHIASIQPVALCLVGLAAALLLWRKLSVPMSLAILAIAGATLQPLI
ncbi:MAG: chromate efflux transporter [Aliishimia sp.]